MRFFPRLAVLILIWIGTARCFSIDDFQEKALRFNEHWGLFLRAYAGCPPHAADTRECNPKLGTFDYAEFNKAAKEARALFALQEKP